MTTYEEVVECVITGGTHIWNFPRSQVKELDVQLSLGNPTLTVGVVVGSCGCGARISITKPLNWVGKVKPGLGIDAAFLDRINALPTGRPGE